jgi:hypothetical protein
MGCGVAGLFAHELRHKAAYNALTSLGLIRIS